MTALPDEHTIYRVIGATWPAARVTRLGPWTIRDGQGGGSRVSAATAEEPVSADDLPQAEAAMRALGQPAKFMIRAGDDALDALLADHGYVVRDTTVLYAAPIARMLGHVPAVMALPSGHRLRLRSTSGPQAGSALRGWP